MAPKSEMSEVWRERMEGLVLALSKSKISGAVGGKICSKESIDWLK